MTSFIFQQPQFPLVLLWCRRPLLRPRVRHSPQKYGDGFNLPIFLSLAQNIGFSMLRSLVTYSQALATFCPLSLDILEIDQSLLIKVCYKYNLKVQLQSAPELVKNADCMIYQWNRMKSSNRSWITNLCFYKFSQCFSLHIRLRTNSWWRCNTLFWAVQSKSVVILSCHQSFFFF